MLYIHTVYTKWKPEFGAPPLPDFVMGPLLLLKSVWQPTKVEPFNLKTKERGHQHSTKCLQKLCVISQLAYVCPWWHIHSVMVELPFAFEVIEILFPGWRRFSEGKAEAECKEASVVYSKPFVVLKSSKPLTDVNNFQLHSEVLCVTKSRQYMRNKRGSRWESRRT